MDSSAPGYPRDAQYAFDEPQIGPIRPDLPHIQRRVRDILRYAQPPGRALDIGCGKGEVALALCEKGFECAGIDMKATVISHLQTHFSQIDWRCTTMADLAETPNCYDVLTLYHVLEHLSDPRSALAGVRTLASPGALVVIEVPNVGGWEARLKGRRWHYYKLDHVNYFRESDLRRLAADLGMIVLGVRGYQHFSYPQDVFWKDLVKGALGRFGFQDVITIFLKV
ncbi:MAG: class I SAM-dependent methyltransferase [Burkholderiales bacterium]|nr:class I SAM-dependent methyltransferase [Burkholderiales bacterium]